MTQQTPIAEPYKSGQGVIAFLECEVSGETIGYCGTIIRVLNSSVRCNRFRPDLWVYRVLLPDNRCLDVPAYALVLTDEMQDVLPLGESICEVQFDSNPASDNNELHGAYWLRASGWKSFVFRKWDEPFASRHVSLPIDSDGRLAPTDCYNVPRDQVLDRQYVLRVIGELVGASKWEPS